MTGHRVVQFTLSLRGRPILVVIRKVTDRIGNLESTQYSVNYIKQKPLHNNLKHLLTPISSLPGNSSVKLTLFKVSKVSGLISNMKFVSLVA